MRTLLFTFVTLMLPTMADAMLLRGRIIDSQTGEAVSDATLHLGSDDRGLVTGEFGEFEGTFDVEFPLEITVRHVAYWPETFTIPSNTSLPLRIELRPRAWLGEDVTYGIDRVERESATVPFENVTGEEVRQRHFAQDLPVLLEGQPSLTTTTDAGSGLGYSYLSLRGFDFRRVTVLLNGVMLNEPEDFYVYWVDLPDFGANVEDVQVQRGAGSALLGLPAVGGTIDVHTRTFSEHPGITAEYGLGSYNTQRASVHLQSGPLKGRYFMEGRFSRITSDGYRDDSWSDYFSYYLSAARVDDSMRTRVVLFGGPISNHMAYAGITRAQADQNRTLNPLSYPELADYVETDNFYQPHYQLHHDWDLRDDLHLSNTLYYIRGEGYFNVFYPAAWGYTLDFWGLEPILTDDSDLYPDAWYWQNEDGTRRTDPNGNEFVNLTDAVARQWVANHQGGWQPRLTWTPNKRHTLDIGGQIISHRSRRWGELTWAAALPTGTDPDHVWYDYQGRKRVIGGYVQDEWTPQPGVSITGAVQIANIEYGVRHDRRFGAEFTQPYTFVMPRLGASWKATDRLRAWGSISRITREPRLKDHYWAETGYPVTRYDDPVNFEDPQIDPETLTDLELGLEWRNRTLFAALTGYWMELENEIVDIGQYDVLGQPVIENADRTRRIGIEAALRLELEDGWFAAGNVTVSRNRFVDYTTDVTVAGPFFVPQPVTVDLSDNRIINAPELLGNLAVGIRKPEWQIRLALHHVGERFVANTEYIDDEQFIAAGAPSGSPTLRQNRALDAYTRVDLDAYVRLLGNERTRGLVNRVNSPVVELIAHLRNLLDSEYFLSGSADAWGVYVIPAATRHGFVGIKVRL